MQQKSANKKAENAQNLLSWMIECEDGSDPSYLAHLEIVVSLASIHTTQMNIVHVLYDLAANPEYINQLREEIQMVAQRGWNKGSFSQLLRLDSFLKESQRFNPPSILSMHRIMQQSHQLSDGTELPKGSHICMPVDAIQNDAEITTDPSSFDGLRYFKMRQAQGERHLHQFATAEKTRLNFGYGKYACPGRFFASLEIKVILVKLIMNYDFKLPPQQGRPQNLMAHEFIFPNPEGKLLFRERGKNFSPF